MNKELNTYNKKTIIRTRYFLNIVWGIALTSLLFVYDQKLQSPIGELLLDNNYQNFFLYIIPFLAIQGFFHWLILEHFYPQKRITNVFWVLFMPVLSLVSYAFLLGALYAQVFKSLR